MVAADVIDAPQINPAGAAADQSWRHEYDAFLRLLPDLAKTHPDKFVAIHHGAVVAVADTFKDAAMEAYKRVGYVPLHVGLVSQTPRPPVRMPLPRIATSAVSG